MFGKKQPAVAVTDQKSTLAQQEVIQEIHHSFYTAVEDLLAWAKIPNSLESENKSLLEKSERLKKLGFSSAQSVKDASGEEKRIAQLVKENSQKVKLIAAINYFSVKYPMYKFITVESVKNICKKYGLVYGIISKYTGEVPDKNLEQMEAFKIDENDECYLMETLYRYARGSGIYYIDIQKYNEFIAGHSRNSSWDENGSSSVSKCSIEIVAPAKDFDMEDSEIKDFQVTQIPAEDPIVLQPVVYDNAKYYLIVTAWGIESKDTDVVNQINN